MARLAGKRHYERDRVTTALLALYLGLWTFPFVYAAARVNVFTIGYAYFWAVAVIVAAALIVLLHHHRWAWILLLAFDSLVLASFVWDWAGVASLSLSILHVAALLSPQIRRYVGKPVMLTA